MSHALKEGDRLYLIDGSAYIFRAFHALPPLSRASDGLPIGAVSGFCNMIYKLLTDLEKGEKPTHLAVIFDHSEQTFRQDIYADYKANRPPPPEDLKPQFPLVRDATRAFGLPSVEAPGYEADDLIATYARQARAAGAETVIVSSDKDLMQLIGDRVMMVDTMKDRRIDTAAVIEKFGVAPEKMIDLQALTGDSTDNVPGAPGIGPKTAAQLLDQFGDLETLLARAEEIPQKKRRETLLEFAEQIRVSKALVTLKDDVPETEPIESFRLRPLDPEPLLAFFDQMEMRTLARRVRGAFDVKARESDGDAPSEPSTDDRIDRSTYRAVFDFETLDALLAAAREEGVIAVDTETNDLDAAGADLVGVCLCVAPGEAVYVPVGHVVHGLDGDREAIAKQLPRDAVLARLRPILEDPAILKIGQNYKYDYAVLKRCGVETVAFDDTMLMSYAMEGGLHGHGMDELAGLHLDHACIPFKEVAGTGKAQVTFDKVPIDRATTYAAEDADVTLRLWRRLKPRLASSRVTTVYETLERPLAAVLADMELAGVKVDRDQLSRLSHEFAQTMARLEDQAFAHAGERFNLGSPKQLGEILFDKLGLSGGKKTKTGAWSTGADELERLAAEGHDLPQTLLEWRKISKLKSTYADALADAIHPKTGRVHTSYAMAATTTGRLASTDPNLQNIPIRTEEGRMIRRAFIADEGQVLISADYSQIELRLLAEIADVPALKRAFQDGLDIHAMTASEIFGVPQEGMDPMVRRKAKAINFGIVYGISGYGLGLQLGVPRSEAQDYIDRYFVRFPEIKDYMAATKEKAREDGYVTTAFGRRCWIREIKAKAVGVRQNAERQAINARIQGSAADVIRRAMIRMPAAIAEAKLAARMLLQVHDELVFECPETEADRAIDVIRRVMRSAAEPAIQFDVPLEVEARAAPSWDEAH